MAYKPIALDQSVNAPEFSVIAVIDGVAAWAIYSHETPTGTVLMMPEYETFITMFDNNVTMVKHPLVQPGTPWDGTKFVEEDRTGFVEIGQI